MPLSSSSLAIIVKCKLQGDHSWPLNPLDLPDHVLFQAMNCQRCGLAVDAVALRDLLRELEKVDVRTFNRFKRSFRV